VGRTNHNPGLEWEKPGKRGGKERFAKLTTLPKILKDNDTKKTTYSGEAKEHVNNKKGGKWGYLAPRQEKGGGGSSLP